MPPDFLMPESKNIQFFGKIESEKNTKDFIINNNKIIHAWYIREAPGDSTYISRRRLEFLVKIVRN